MEETARDVLIFDEATHTYTVNGVRIPNVTSILKEANLGTEVYWEQWHLDRGKAVHKACQFLALGELEWTSVDPEILDYVRGYEKFLRENQVRPILVEKRGWNHEYRYASTLDLYAEMGGEDCLIEIKTTKVPATAALQTAAQLNCDWEKRVPIHKIRRLAIELHADATYKVIEFKDRNDFQVFLSALALNNWKRNHE